MNLLLSGNTWERAGGLPRYFRLLAEGLSGRGHRVRCVVVGQPGPSPPGIQMERFAALEVPLPVRMWRASGPARRFGASFDLYNPHFAPYAVAPSLYLASRGVPIVCHFHGPWAAEELVEREAPCRFWLKKFIERLAYRRATMFITLSVAFKELLAEEYGVEPERIHVIPGGVDLTAFRPTRDRREARRALGLVPDRPIIFTLRRLVRRMGLESLLSAIKMVREDYPDLLLVIGGDGPLRAELEREISTLRLERNVQLLGFIPEKDLQDYYRAADLFVLPSVTLEGFGMVTLEALACGTPVIGTPVGGTREILERLDRRLLTADTGSPAIAEKIAEAVKDHSWLPAPERCRHFVEREYDWETTVSKIETLFETITKQAPASHRLTREPRIAFLNHSGEISGAEISLLQTMKALDRDGVQPFLIAPENGELARRARTLGFRTRTERFGAPRMTQNPLRLASGVFQIATGSWRLARILRDESVDIVHANSIRAGLMASLARPLHRHPVIWNVRDFLPKNPVGIAIRGLAFLTAARIITNSEAVRDDFVRWAPLRAKTQTIYPGLPSSVFDRTVASDFREAWGISPSAFVMGYVGQIAPWKRVHDVILALRKVAKECDHVRLIIAGAPQFRKENHEYLRRLYSLAEEFGLEGRVQFVGFQEEIERVYRSLDVLVHPAAREPFGRVLIEAMAQGVPVIAAAAGGIPEIVRDGQTGFLVPVGDVDMMAGRLLELLKDPSRRLRMGSEGRVVVRSAFHVDRTAPQLLRLYREILRLIPEPGAGRDSLSRGG